MDIKGSPFYPEVFDPCQVKVTRTQCGVVGKHVTFQGLLYRHVCIVNILDIA